MMIDRLHEILPSLEHLPPEAQDEAAIHIAALIESLQHSSRLHTQAGTALNQEPANVEWQDLFGAWSDLGADYETN